MENRVPELQAFNEVSEALEDMRERGKVDLSVLPKFDKLIDRMVHYEGAWSKTRDIPPTDAFALYHAARNMRLVLTATEKRLAISKVSQSDNPKVVDDSLEVLPYLSGLYATVLLVKDQPLDHGVRSLLMERVRNLRKAAAKVSLLPSIEDESAGIDTKALSEGLERVAGAVREIVSEK